MVKVRVVDWSDDAYKEYGGEHVIAEITIEKFTGYSYDGGRLDIDGHKETIWVSNQYSVYVEDI